MCLPRFAYKDEYEKFKLYLTIILILISFTCRFLLNSRWVSCRAGRSPLLAAAGTHPLCPPQGDGRRLQLPAGLVLLHADHPGEHSHQQRLPVGSPGEGALELPGGAGGRWGGGPRGSEGLARDRSPAASHPSLAPCPRVSILGAEGTGVTAASQYRIKGWWVFHHYVSTFLSGVMLTW